MEPPVILDRHRGMAAQHATDLRRVLAEVEENEAALRQRQEPRGSACHCTRNHMGRSCRAGALPAEAVPGYYPGPRSAAAKARRQSAGRFCKAVARWRIAEALALVAHHKGERRGQRQQSARQSRETEAEIHQDQTDGGSRVAFRASTRHEQRQSRRKETIDPPATVTRWPAYDSCPEFAASTAASRG
jgi:hypothetical protein